MSSLKVIPANPRAGYLTHKDEIDAAIAAVLEAGRYVLGPQTEAFETEFAGYIGVDHGIGVGSGTEALHLALRACGVETGDEVITVSHTAVATVAAIELCGAKPVLVDIDPVTYTIDVAKMRAALTARTKAIIPVHLYGHPAKISEVMAIAKEHGVAVIEDCAQSHGATYQDRKTGRWGDMAAFSFYPTKNLGAIGDGGIIVTNDSRLAEKAQLLRQYGWQERYISTIPGSNSRLDELQAAILRVRLKYLDDDNARRRQLANIYTQRLASTDLQLPVAAEHVTHVYHQFVIRSNQRDKLREYLIRKGIGTLIHYPVPIHQQPAYIERLGGQPNLPETERAAREILSLPMYPELANEAAELVANEILNFFQSDRS